MALLVESTGMLFIQPVDKLASIEESSSDHRYFRLSGSDEERKDVDDPEKGLSP